jgi:hypothetical protein
MSQIYSLEVTRTMKKAKLLFSRFALLGELWKFMRVRKKWWLAPLFIILILLGVLIVATEGSALAPFIYTLF